jgi:hypothetical protein
MHTKRENPSLGFSEPQAQRDEAISCLLRVPLTPDAALFETPTQFGKWLCASSNTTITRWKGKLTFIACTYDYRLYSWHDVIHSVHCSGLRGILFWHTSHFLRGLTFLLVTLHRSVISPLAASRIGVRTR